jgi:hypothetical protein
VRHVLTDLQAESLDQLENDVEEKYDLNNSDNTSIVDMEP